MSRKIKKNGVMADVSLDKNKKYKYSATGDLVESTGELGDNEISISGSKSSLRRAADMERNISILATTMLTTDNGAGVDSPAQVKAAAAADATTKANAALASAKAYADQAEADAESAASSDATTKADAALQTALAADSDTTYSVGDGGLTQKNFTTADNAKLDGIATSANNYSLPSSVVHSSEKEALHGTDALSISGHTITLRKGNNSVETVVVPDNNTNTTYSAGTGINLSGTTFSADSTMSTKSYADDAAQAVKTTLLGGAGQAFDTLSEIKTLMDAGDASLTNAINSLPSPGNGTVTVSSGTGMSGGGAFTMNQGHSETVTLSHADTSSQGSVNNGGRTYIQDITLDTMGHITGITSATETVVNTDTNTTYTAAQMLTAVKTVDGSGSGLDADLLDGQHLGQIVPFHSSSDFASGTLVTTNIPATAASGASFVIEVTGKSYSSAVPHSVIAQGYLYSSTVINVSGSNLAGSSFTYMKVMENGGYLSFWWPRHGYWNSYSVSVRDAGGNSTNRVSSISNSVDPTGANKKVTINLAKTYNALNDGVGSGLDADLLDGQQGSYYMPASNANQSLNTTNSPTFANVYTSNTGKLGVGDDVFFKDVGQGNTAGVVGQQNSDRGYLTFGNHSTQLGRIGTGALTWGGNALWHAGNDGSGSGLDADKLDGQQGSYYYPASNPNGYTNDQSAAEILTKIKTVDGSGSGLDADLLDGVNGASYLRSDAENTTASFSGKVDFQGHAAIEGGSGYGLFKGYAPNYNHFIASRGAVSGSTASPTITGTHHTTFVEYCDGTTNGFYFKSSNTGTYEQIASITRAGITSSGDITAYSDERLKSDIVTIPNALDTVSKLRGVNYIKDDKASTGVIAQEVEAVIPELVHTADDEMGTKSVAYGNMMGVMIEAIKELTLMVESQAAEIAKLKK